MSVACQLNHPRIPLSESPRTPRRVPIFQTLESPVYVGDFREATCAIVNLHGQGTYDLVKELAVAGIHLYVRRDLDNAHDENAVSCHLKVNRSFELVGYLGREDAAPDRPRARRRRDLEGQAARAALVGILFTRRFGRDHDLPGRLATATTIELWSRSTATTAQRAGGFVRSKLLTS